MALVTAGSYLGQSVETVEDYFHVYEEYWDELDNTTDELYSYEDRTLFSAWNLSLAQVRAQGPNIAELPRLLAYLGNKGITYDLLQAGKESDFGWLSSLTMNQRQFNRAMSRLHDYSFVEMSEGSYSLHSCVHGWTLQTLNRDLYAPYFWLAAHCVASNVKGDSERDHWKVNQQLTHHALRLEHQRFQNVLNSDNFDESQCDSLHSLALLWSYSSEFVRSEAMYHRALMGYKKAFGPGYTSTLDTANKLGALYRDQGKMAETKKMYQRALTGRGKALGPGHTSVELRVYMVHRRYV